MADSDDDERSGDESDFDVDAAAGGQLSEKEQKTRDKLLPKWRIFLDFLLRHVAVVNFKYNVFEHDEKTAFLMAVQKAELLGQAKVEKMKKAKERTKYVDDETRRLACFRQMRACVELLEENRLYGEARRIRTYMDLMGRMKGLGLIGGGFHKWLKKDKRLQGVDQCKYYVDYWKGFTLRGYDYTQLQVRGASPADSEGLEGKYQVWLGVLRTALHLAQKYLKRCSDVTGLSLLTDDPKVLVQHMSVAEFAVARSIEDALAKKVAAETKTFLLGSPLVPHKQSAEEIKFQKMLEDVNPEYLKPIPPDGYLLELPSDVPKEKKKKKKGKGKGKGRSSSSGKKKKRKK